MVWYNSIYEYNVTLIQKIVYIQVKNDIRPPIYGKGHTICSQLQLLALSISLFQLGDGDC